MLKGEGETGYKGGPKGDLYITIHIKKHNIYKARLANKMKGRVYYGIR